MINVRAYKTIEEVFNVKVPAENIFLNINITDKDELLKFVAKQASKLGYTDSKKKLYESFVEREAEYSTGLQEGFAIPHAKTDFVNRVGIIYVRTNSIDNWETYDDQPVTDIFALMVPEKNAGTTHLKMLSNLATALLVDKFKMTVRSLKSSEEISKYITKEIGANVL